MILLPNRSENKNFLRIFLPIYLLLMFFSYGLYLFLEKYRLLQAEERMMQNDITEQDMSLMDQLGKWPMYAEEAFFFIFIVTAVYLFIRYRKNRRYVNVFLVVNGILFAGIYLISLLLTRLLDMTIGNMYQPMIVPAQFLILLFIYTLFRRRKECQERCVRQFVK